MAKPKIRKKARTLPAIHERLSLERELLKAHFRVINKLAKFVRDEIVPAAKEDRKEQLKRFSDNARDPRYDDYDALAKVLVKVASDTVERVLKLDGSRHTKTWINSVKRTLGVDLKNVVTQPDIAPEISEYLRINTDLITNISTDLKKRIGLTVSNHVVNGGTVKDLGAALNKDFGFAKSRAKLIAADQTQKFNASLTEIRQVQAGIKQYRWLTSRDEKVRKRHRALDGKVYKWNEPTGAEGGQKPGHPVRCRCVAIAVLDEVQTPTLAPEQEQTIEDEAKDYVLTNGKAATKEYLFTYNLLTGEKIGTNKGRKSEVLLDAATLRAVYSKDKIDVVAHHNHPSSSSFSKADLDLLTDRNNLKVLYAHGHDGSSYKGTDIGDGKIAMGTYKRAFKYTKDRLVNLARAGIVSPSDADQVFSHIMMLRLVDFGAFEYEFNLSKRQQDIMSKIEGYL